MKPDQQTSDLERQVILLALRSRLAILVLQFIFNLIIPDHQSDAFVSPFTSLPKTSLDTGVDWLLGGLLRWDAQYHLHVSIYGYVYENSLAFFPGFAVCIKLIGSIVEYALFPLNIVSVHLISALLFNLVCFTLAAKALYRLSVRKLQDANLAFLACTLFCINPASIFFTAPYSESLFSLLTFTAMLAEDGTWKQYFVISLSAIVRSNGVTNLGFPAYGQLKKHAYMPKSILNWISFLVQLAVIVVSTMSLFFLYQMYSYIRFCTNYPYKHSPEVIETALAKSYVLAGQGTSGMCNQTHVIPYFYIQNHYWNVGFLEYFQLKQIPNFALAFPIIHYVSTECISYFKRNTDLTKSLGLSRVHQNTRMALIYEYIVHLSVLLVICLFFVHIQVATRILCSSSPALYWLWAMIIYSKEKKTVFSLSDVPHMTTVSFTIFSYCLIYCVLGTILFSNHYPWT
ncbi:GPI mannosyltransferase 2-like [Planococcus citri]|uniref:GPI mannosyltransferase 2-like n=1 Tax=Planococcus citri TaxID=170843 RepID=UPI0031F92CF6